MKENKNFQAHEYIVDLDVCAKKQIIYTCIYPKLSDDYSGYWFDYLSKSFDGGCVDLLILDCKQNN